MEKNLSKLFLKFIFYNYNLKAKLEIFIMNIFDFQLNIKQTDKVALILKLNCN